MMEWDANGMGMGWEWDANGMGMGCGGEYVGGCICVSVSVSDCWFVVCACKCMD